MHSADDWPLEIWVSSDDRLYVDCGACEGRVSDGGEFIRAPSGDHVEVTVAQLLDLIRPHMRTCSRSAEKKVTDA